MTFSPDSRFLAAGYEDGTVKIWDSASGALVNTIQLTIQSTACTAASLDISSDGKTAAFLVFYRAGTDSVVGRIKLWDLAANRETAEFSSDAGTVSLSPDAERVVMAGWDGTVSVWNIKSQKRENHFTKSEGGYASAAFSPDGAQLAMSWSQGRSVRLWNFSYRSEVRVFTQDGGAQSVSFSPDGQMLVSQGLPDAKTGAVEFRLWDLKSGNQILEFEVKAGSVGFRKNGDIMAVSAEGRTVKVWNARTKASIKTFDCNGNVLFTLFSPDGSLAGAGLDDCTFYLAQI